MKRAVILREVQQELVLNREVIELLGKPLDSETPLHRLGDLQQVGVFMVT